MALKLLSLNIEGDNHFDKIFPFFEREQADVICLQEVFESDLPLISQKTGMDFTFLPNWIVIKENPYRLSPRGKQGIAMLTALPVTFPTLTYYVGNGTDLPDVVDVNPDQVHRGLIVGDVIKENKTYRIGTTHFTWSEGGKVTDNQRKHLEKFLQIVEPLESMILCGDFNAPRGKEIFDTLANRYTDNIPKEILTTMDQKLHRVSGLQFVVDVLFTSPRYQAQNVQVFDGVSDHCAVVASIEAN